MKKPTPLNAAGAAALVIVLAGCSSDCESTRSCGTYTPTDGGEGGATGGTHGSGGGGTGASSGMSTGGGSGTTNGGGGGGGAVPGGGGSAGMRDGSAGEPGIKDAGPDVAPDTRPPCDAASAPNEDACVVDEKYAVFVSPLGSDATGDGTRTSPYATIGKGVASAQAESLRVYACASAGTFAESVTFDGMNDGAALFGGFDCDTWAYVAGTPTKVTSTTTTGLKVTGLTAGLRVEDFDVSAADATEPGGSSFGAFVSGSKNVVFRRVRLTAGKGAKGADGMGDATPALTGATGNGGTAACIVTGPNPMNLGGAAAPTICDGVSVSAGGKGGFGGNDDSTAGAGDQGQPLSQTGGADGKGEGNSACTSGGDGAPTASQPTASGASSRGTLATSGYAPSDGSTGLNGAPGQGGGGGGGAKAPTCGTKPRTGASGGSGGGGGCGGKGGTGGAGGGASIALASVDSTITLDGCDLTAQAGGNGGKGGLGQPGGTGGARGEGKSGGSANPSCDGGRGGKGGNGGNGGGGAGGPSLAIAHTGTAPAQMDTTSHFSPTPAPGGADGAGLTTGVGAGAAGLAASVSSF